MAAPWKRRALALSAPLALAIAVAAAVSDRGCDDSDKGPEEAVRRFLDAAVELDREAMFGVLGEKTRNALELAAREATDRSSRRYSAAEMISVDSEIRTYDREGASDFVRVVSQNASSAVVEIRDLQNRTHQLEVVRQDGRWVIEL